LDLGGLIGDYPVLERYYGGLRQRPAHRRAYAEVGDGAGSSSS